MSKVRLVSKGEFAALPGEMQRQIFDYMDHRTQWSLYHFSRFNSDLLLAIGFDMAFEKLKNCEHITEVHEQIHRIKKGLELVKKVMGTNRGKNAMENPGLWVLCALLGKYYRIFQSELPFPGLAGLIFAPISVRMVMQTIAKILKEWVPRGKRIIQEGRIPLNQCSPIGIEYMKRIGLFEN